MKAIEISQFGGPEVLKLVERPTPEPVNGEVLIRVHAAGVNRPDAIQRIGKYPPPPGASDLPGLEVAGEIVKSRSDEWREGDKVCALLAGGGYAEYAAAPAGQCLPIPDKFDMLQAACLPETVFTVWNNLFKHGRLKKGETVLIHGGSSGIGTTAIQMAKAAGARVIITAGTAQKCEACRALGADQAINYKEADFAEVIGESNVDVVLDMVGGDYLPRNLKVLKPGGRHVSIAFLNGAMSEISIPTVMHKRLILTGTTLRPRPQKEKKKLRDEILKTIWPQVNAGKITPVIDKTFPLAEAAAAHEALEADHIGKVVLLVT